jgi:predicted O-methyltransferase YrrM
MSKQDYQKKKNDPVFDNHSKDATILLAQIYQSQVNVFLPLEFICYYESMQWHNSNLILDIGTGNGYYLNQLATRFPNKSYFGIDISEKMINIANRDFALSNIKFEVADFFSIKGKFDFIILRLVVQHQPSFEAVLDRCVELASPKASILIIDALEDGVVYHPPPKILLEFYKSLRVQRKSVGADYDIMNLAQKKVASHPAWRIGAFHRLILPSTIPGHREKLIQMEKLILSFMSVVKPFEFDFAAALAEWNEWSTIPDAYLHEGLMALRIDLEDDKQ